MTSYDEYVQYLKDAHKAGDVCVCAPNGNCDCRPDARKSVLPDGHRVRIRMQAMDSVQRAVAGAIPYEQRHTSTWDALNPAAAAAFEARQSHYAEMGRKMQVQADARLEAATDHYSGAQARAEAAYDAYTDYLSNAHKEAA